MADSAAASRKGVAIIVIALVIGIPAFIFKDLLLLHWWGSSFPTNTLQSYEQTLKVPGSGEEKGSPYRTGKVVLVIPTLLRTKDSGNVYKTGKFAEQGYAVIEDVHIDPQWVRLSGDIRAGSPEEVGTVIFCEHGSEVVGYYAAEGTPAPRPAGRPKVADEGRRRHVVLKVYSTKEKRFTGTHVLWGEMPERKIEAGESQAGKVPDIAAWIQAMPAR